MKSYLVTDVNPEPWAIGPLDVIWRNRKPVPIVGPNGKLQAYQKALQDEMRRLYPDMKVHTGWLHVSFLFFRSSDHGQPADTTNLVKATEDALQGLLYDNDRNNRRVWGDIVEQTPTTRPAIYIITGSYQPPDVEYVLEAISERKPLEAFSEADWTPPEPNKEYF